MPNVDRRESYRASPPISTNTEKKAAQFDDRPDRDWLNPISMSKLQVAVKAEAKTVELNGVMYDIRYGYTINMPVSGDRREIIRLKRKDGKLVPFGYVSVQRILDFHFESGE